MEKRNSIGDNGSPYLTPPPLQCKTLRPGTPLSRTDPGEELDRHGLGITERVARHDLRVAAGPRGVSGHRLVGDFQPFWVAVDAPRHLQRDERLDPWCELERTVMLREACVSLHK
jgi:hypothetical protein